MSFEMDLVLDAVVVSTEVEHSAFSTHLSFTQDFSAWPTQLPELRIVFSGSQTQTLSIQASSESFPQSEEFEQVLLSMFIRGTQMPRTGSHRELLTQGW